MFLPPVFLYYPSSVLVVFLIRVQANALGFGVCVWGEGVGVGEGADEIYPQPMDTSLKPIDLALGNLNGVVGLKERLI